MRRFRLFLRVALVVVIGLIIVVGIWQLRIFYRYGEAIVFCPGPDLYGYWCEPAEIAYIDATNDTRLYEDDGTIAIPIPFDFTFYGRTYTELEASTNGNIQFGNENASFRNTCLNEATDVGDMIAPYWDDLTLVQRGFLEYEVVGTPPDRIFVIEWDDVPRFANPDDQVTFEIQLFEGSNDIVFLYDQVKTLTNPNGRSATIGIKSEQQGLALIYSCDQVSVFNGGGVHVYHPSVPNPELVSAAPRTPTFDSNLPFAKGEIGTLIEEINTRGEDVLPDLQRRWLLQQPGRQTSWAWEDVTGDGRRELVLVWQAQPTYAELSQLVVLTRTGVGTFELLDALPLVGRAEPGGVRTLHSVVDKSGDGVADIIISDGENGRFVYTWQNNAFERMR